MKKTLLPILSLAAIVQAHAGQATPPGSFRVLLVGVDHYSKGNTHWGNLEGTKDVDMMKRVLTLYWGKTPGFQIKELCDAQATGAAIKNAFDNWLVKDAKPTDRMLFFFSGHGTLVPAPDLPTGRRSAILPYDAKGDATGIDPKSVVQGDFFRDELHDLKQKRITNLTLMFDACNSAAIARGGVAIAKTVPNPALDRTPTPKGQMEGVGLSTDLDLSGSMVISAARADRCAWQGTAGGNLTVAFAEAVHTYFGRRGQAKVDHEMTYRDLKDGIMATLAGLPQPTAQEPAFSGGLDREVFGAKAGAVEPYYLVTVADGQTKVAAGSLFGIGAGSTFAVYAPGTTDFAKAKPVAHAAIATDGAGLYESTVTITGYAGDPKALNSGRARLVDGTPDAALAVDLSALDANPTYRNVADGIVTGSLFRRADAQNLQAKVIPPGTAAKGLDAKSGAWTAQPGAWTVVDAAGNDLASIHKLPPIASGSPTVVDDIRGELRLVAQRKAVLDLATPLPEVRVEMQIVPVTVANKVVTTIDEDHAVAAGSAELTEGQRFALRVKATLPDGKTDPMKSLYLAVLDLTPNGLVGQLWPRDVSGFLPAGESTRIVADGTWRYFGSDGTMVGSAAPSKFAAWHLDPKDGQGQEVFKLLAADVSGIDYGPLLTTSMGEERGPASPIGRILRAFRDGTAISRAPMDTTESTNFSVTSVTLNLKRSDAPAAPPKP